MCTDCRSGSLRTGRSHRNALLSPDKTLGAVITQHVYSAGNVIVEGELVPDSPDLVIR